MVYLDSAAATIPKFFAKDYYYFWGNPNSNNWWGIQAKNALDSARDSIKNSLGLSSGKVVFVRSSSEAVELLKRLNDKVNDRNMWCVDFEHKSVYDICLGCIPYTNNKHQRNEIYLHQYVNNISGEIFNIKTIGSFVKSFGTFFGSDFTAAIGRVTTPDRLEDFCDAIWVSGRKIGAEGMAFLWLSDDLFNFLGGNENPANEYGFVNGTMNVGGAVALSYAVQHAVNYQKDIRHYEKLYRTLIFGLKEKKIDFFIKKDKNSNYCNSIIALTLPEVDADSLVQFLSSNSIYVSPGYSACSTKPDYSQLLALGYMEDEAKSTIRISFCEDNTKEDIRELVDAIYKFKNI